MPGGRQHEFVVPVRFRIDDDGDDFRVSPDFLHVPDRLRLEFASELFGPSGVMVPDPFDLGIGPLLHQVNKTGSVNMGAPDEGQGELFFALCPNGGEPAGGNSSDAGSTNKFSTGNVHVHTIIGSNSRDGSTTGVLVPSALKTTFAAGSLSH